MSFWDNVKKFAQPYADDDYDDYDEDDEYLDEEEEYEAPAPVHPAALQPAALPLLHLQQKSWRMTTTASA